MESTELFPHVTSLLCYQLLKAFGLSTSGILTQVCPILRLRHLNYVHVFEILSVYICIFLINYHFYRS